MKPIILVALLSFGALFPKGTAAKPNPVFSLTVQAPDSVLPAGIPVRIKITFTNTSETDLPVGGAFNNMTGVDVAFEFDIRDGTGKVAEKKKHKHPELATYTPILGRTLKPGASFTEEQDISRLYDFSTPGEYSITVSRSESPHGNGPMIHSNTVKITIAPANAPSPQP